MDKTNVKILFIFTFKKKLNDTLFHFDVVMMIIDQRTIPSGQEKNHFKNLNYQKRTRKRLREKKEQL
jgi:hypothetical protein